MADHLRRGLTSGAKIKVTVTEDGSAIDPSSATTHDLLFLAPDGTTEYRRTADLITEDDVTLLQWLVDAEDDSGKSIFDTMAGWWLVKADLAFPGSGYVGPTDVGRFRVKNYWEI